MSDKTSESVVDTVFDVGKAWVSYGLKVAELALTASATTLTNVSKMLRAIEEELKHESDHTLHADVIETTHVEP